MPRTSTVVQALSSAILAISAVLLVLMLVRPAQRAQLAVDESTQFGEMQAQSWEQFTQGTLVLGNPSAENALVVFTDYECEFCRSYHHILREAIDSAQGRLRVLVRTFPLQVLHPDAVKLALVAHCAAKQSRFETAHDLLTDSTTELRELSPMSIGQRLGVENTRAFATCVQEDAELPRIAEDIRVGRELGISKLPKVLFQERRYSAPPPTTRILRDLADGATAEEVTP